VSRSTSELVSASLRYLGVVSFPDWMKPEKDGEEAVKRNRLAPRGGRRQRASKETIGTWEVR